LLEAELGTVQVVLYQFDREPTPTETLCGLARHVGSGEGVQHDIAGCGAQFDEELGKASGKPSGMDWESGFAAPLQIGPIRIQIS
jgi:hypothetical protein